MKNAASQKSQKTPGIPGDAKEKDRSRLVIDALNRAYVCSYLVRLDSGALSVLTQSSTARTVDIEGLSAREGLAVLSRKLVSESYLDRMLAFLDTDTLAERMDDQASLVCEYLSTIDSGWCRGTWLPVDRDDAGKLTCAMFCVASIDSAEQEKMHRDRESAELMKLHYEAAESMIGAKVVSLMLFDRETGEGRAWKHGDDFFRTKKIRYDDLVERGAGYLDEADRSRLRRILSLEKVRAAVDEDGRYKATGRYLAPGGSVKYLSFHFSAYSRNPKYLFAVVEDSTASHEKEGRSVEDLYDNVPGGLVSYEWNNGALIPIHVSRRYRNLFGRTSTVLSDEHGVDYRSLHPDDVAAYMREVVDALASRREVHHIYRVWADDRCDYIWVKIDAVVKRLVDGRTVVYAMYSNVSELMQAKQNLVQAGKSLEEALKASGQSIWEYDPVERTATCFTEQNALGLPRRIENYPESLDSFGIFYPQDREVFAEAVRKIDAGADQAECNTRIKVNGKPHWFACKLCAHGDWQAGHRAITLFVTDINVRVNASNAFNNRLRSLVYANESALVAGVYNVTKDKTIETFIQGKEVGFDEAPRDYGDMCKKVASRIKGEDSKKKYLETFSRDSLLALANAGEFHASMECLYQVAPNRTEWMEISADLAIDPVSGDVEAVGFAKSINELWLSNMLIKESLKGSTNSAAVLLNGGSEYYLFDALRQEACVHHVDYWSDLQKVLTLICEKGEFDWVSKSVAKENVLARLAEEDDLRITFSADLFGKRCRLEVRFSNVEGQEGIVFVSVRDITDSKMLQKLRYDARHDALTGLYNRNTVFSRCEELLKEYPETAFAVLKLNVRRFRLYNAFFGEEAGDKLLKDVAVQMEKIMGERDKCVYGRMESDIFCAIFPMDELALGRYVEKIRQYFQSYTDDFLLEPAIGIYVATDPGIAPEGMFARASSAAKEGGTKISECAWRYNDELERKLNAELTIAKEMHSALEQGQFAVYLQPKYNLQTGEHAGAEALVRWIHPERGMVSPGAFIPVFESNGFILSLDRYMWEQVCKLLRKWIDQGVDVKPVSVNMSRVSAFNPTTAAFLEDLVARYRIDPALLEVELTESAYIDESGEVVRCMRALQSAGFRILMDDFGSGYSSLNALRTLPVDVLKLDIGFLSETCEDERGRTVIDSILGMARRLGLPVIAEGVENEKQADFLRSAWCDYVQGYLFARPMPVEDYEKLS